MARSARVCLRVSYWTEATVGPMQNRGLGLGNRARDEPIVATISTAWGTMDQGTCEISLASGVPALLRNILDKYNKITRLWTNCSIASSRICGALPSLPRLPYLPTSGDRASPGLS
jgi:hypothetical protein